MWPGLRTCAFEGLREEWLFVPVSFTLFGLFWAPYLGSGMNDWIDAEFCAEHAYLLYEKGRWAEAAAELRVAIDINPYNSAWHFNLALTLEALEQYELACRAYRMALEIDPGDVETLNCLGVNLTRVGRYRESLRHFERIQRIDPQYEPAYCNRIVTYAEMGDHDNAEVMFYLARQIVDECPLCFYNMASSLYARGDYPRAVYCWDQTLRLDPDHLEAHGRIAEVHWLLGDLQNAKLHYQAELELAEDPDVDLLLDYGDLLLDMGQLDEAQEKFELALAVEPADLEAHFCLGELALKRNQLTVAEAQFRLVLELDPKFPGAHTKLGRILLRQGFRRDAARHLLVDMANCRDDPDLLAELGELLIEARQTTEANAAFRQLVDLRPDDPQVRHNLAVSFFMLDKIDDGIRHCRRALKLRPGYPLALYNLALAYLRKGQLPRARRYAARAMMICPGDEHVCRLSRQLGMTGLLSRLRNRLTGGDYRDNMRR